MTPTRRDLLSTLGLGGVALAWMLHRDRPARAAGAALHHAAKAKRVIWVFAPGGVSHIDTFDHKPGLAKLEGKPLPPDRPTETFFNQPGVVMPSPFRFARHGGSGHWFSSLFPHLSRQADRMTFIHGMKAKSSNHTPAAFQMNTGFVFNGYPSVGAWLSYGLGSLNADYPTFVVLPDPRGLPAGGATNWTAGFLPASHQGVPFGTGPEPVRSLRTPADTSPARREAELAMLRTLEADFAARTPGDDAVAARVRSYELAARMQARLPEALDIDRAEPARVRRLYGLDDPACAGFGRNCLLARRLLERGVRFVQLWHGGAFGSPRINWDAHEDIVDNHTTQARNCDKPLAALLEDLAARGMLDDTLVVWTTEFGRSPSTQGVQGAGRDHHPHAFSVWLAGAGLRAGTAFGGTDELGFGPANNPVTIYDLHATVLHLLGLDHTRLTYYHNGTQRRLTDVHGEVVEDVLA